MFMPAGFANFILVLDKIFLLFIIPCLFIYIIFGVFIFYPVWSKGVILGGWVKKPFYAMLHPPVMNQVKILKKIAL